MAAREPIVVMLSHDMADLMPLFLGQRKIDMAKLNAALPAADFEAIRRVGHGMTGAGASYGLDHISVLGERLVVAARAGDVPALHLLTQELEDYLSRLTVKYM